MGPEIGQVRPHNHQPPNSILPAPVHQSSLPELSLFELHVLDARSIAASIGLQTNARIIERALDIPRKRSLYRASARYLPRVDHP